MTWKEINIPHSVITMVILIAENPVGPSKCKSTDGSNGGKSCFKGWETIQFFGHFSPSQLVGTVSASSS